MRKLHITASESAWLKIFGLIGVFVGVMYFLSPLLPGFKNDEPLADAESLRQLEKGVPLAIPVDERWGEFLGKQVAALPPTAYTVKSQVLGETTAPKRIEVDLTNQKVYAFEGNTKVYEFLVSTGKWAPTPTGTFTIWTKVRSQKMSGGSKALRTYYYLPNVPYVMFFANDEIPKYKGFSLHGTYWHNNFGHPMSHGCVNMKIEDAKTLYEWATPVVTNTKAWSTSATADNPGTTVIIYGVTPKK